MRRFRGMTIAITILMTVAICGALCVAVSQTRLFR
jgi:hypothetical protein